jgi:hypothetical protein
VNGIAPLAENQYQLTLALDPDLSFDFPNVTPTEFERYREDIQRQKAIWDELDGMQAPAFMAESHRLRTLAASQIYEAAAMMIGEIERWNFYPGSSALMAQGRSQFEVGMGTLADAEFGLQIWQQLSEGAYLQ